MPFIRMALGLLAAACTTNAADEAPRTARPPVRVYTNDDLERVHPYAGQTGASSVPAIPAGDDPGPAPEPASGRGEAYWRREAAAVRERVRELEERAAGLRARIAERERPKQETVYGSRKRAATPTSAVSLRASLAAVERRIERTQGDLEDRARREGALPGWLR